MGGMFGQNDNTAQTQNTNPDPGAVPSTTPANPFASNDSPVPPAPSADPLASTPPAPVVDSSVVPVPQPSTSTAGSDDLLGLKQQALQNLQPLVSHLDQSPEEKFKTTMMLIQATDNPALVKQAYEVAGQITDEKARAQALLDVINEINYFTHKDGDQAKS